jgi:hypothetical protein
LGGPTPTFGTPSHDAALATVPPVRTFGTHHWGSAGLQTPPAPQYQANEAFCRPQTRANRTPKPKREINLIDDDYVEDMTVSAPAAMFDPLVNVAAPPETASQPLNNAPSQPRQMQQANIPDPFAQVIPTHHQQRPSKVKPSIQNQNYKPNDASNATGGGMMQTTPLSWNNSMPSCVNGKTMEIGNSMMCTGMIPSATTATSALNISKLMAPEDVFSNLRPAETTIKEININAFDVVR